MNKVAQYRDERGKWINMIVGDPRLTPESIAFESAKRGLITRVIEEDRDGKQKVIKMYRKQMKQGNRR